MTASTLTIAQRAIAIIIAVLRDGGNPRALSFAGNSALSALEPEEVAAVKERLAEAMRDPRLTIPRLRGLSYQLGAEVCHG